MIASASAGPCPARPETGYPSRPAVQRDWVRQAIERLHLESSQCRETDLVRLEIPSLQHVDIYLKDESLHPSGSLKHRLAHSLFMHGLCSGKIGPATRIVECSSGSTAISEAYFARLLSLPFIAVVPEGTAPEKLRQIAAYGGRFQLAKPGDVYSAAEAIAAEGDTCYLDQFTYAERATDWRGQGNLAASILRQMEDQPSPVPEWIVVGAGTGGTATTIGRHLRYARPDCATRLCVVDPERSVFFDYYRTGDNSLRSALPSRIEGIGRPRVEPSFLPQLVDRMIRVPDRASIAALGWLEALTGRRLGASTGTNICGAYQLALELEAAGKPASIVTLICDGGERYGDTCYNPDWLRAQNLEGPDFSAYFQR